MPSFLVKEIKPKDCYFIRHQVLWQHKSFDDCGIDIDDQAGAIHLGAYKGDKLICVASFFKQSQAKFSEKHQYDCVLWLLCQVLKIQVLLEHY